MDTPTDLCIIMGNNKSDKGSQNITKSWHNYTLVYNKLFKDRRLQYLRVFLFGHGTSNINFTFNMVVNVRNIL